MTKKSLEKHFPAQWIERMKEIIPEGEREDFWASSISPLPKTVRIRGDVSSFDGYDLRDIAQIPEAKFITLPPDKPLGKLIPHFTGQMYAASLSSLLAVHLLDPRPEEKILDMCASPGSKSTFIAERMEQTGLLIANELKGNRLPALKQNLDRMGVRNTLVTQKDGTDLPTFFGEEFDKILLDAPCSGDSNGRKDEKFFIKKWREKNIALLSSLQKKLIVSAFEMLKIDGELLYSTCTASPEENEAVIQYLLDTYPDHAEIVPLNLPKIPHKKGVSSFFEQKICSEKTASAVLRLYPHLKNEKWDSEFFFLARIRKKNLTQRSFSPPMISTSPYEILKKNKKAEIITLLRKNYGIDPEPLKKLTFLERENNIYVNTSLASSYLKRTHTLRPGLLIYHREKGITTAFTHHLAQTATQQIYDTSPEDCIKFLYGYDLFLPDNHPFKNGQQILIRYKSTFLGNGKVVGKKLKNKLDKKEVLR